MNPLLAGGKTEPKWRRMYDAAMDGMTSLLLRRTKPSGMLYVGQLHGRSFRPAMEHLACFVGGMLALGAKTEGAGDLTSPRAQRDWKNAKGIAYTCFQVRVCSSPALPLPPPLARSLACSLPFAVVFGFGRHSLVTVCWSPARVTDYD